MAVAAFAVLLTASAASAQNGYGRAELPARSTVSEPSAQRSMFEVLKGAISRLRTSAAPSPQDASSASPMRQHGAGHPMRQHGAGEREDALGPALPEADRSWSSDDAGFTPRLSLQDPSAEAPGDRKLEGDLPPVQPEMEAQPAQPDSDVYARRDKRITEILPYPDYEPDPEIRRTDPLRNQCPSPDNLCPPEVRLGEVVWTPREIAPSIFTWEASNLYHYPLYFEDPDLERYGHTYGCLVQPFDSVGRFSLQLVGLPYQMTIDPAWRRIYTLGWYRPGECAPKLHYQIPWHHQAAINQALVTTGLFYLIP